MMDNLCAVVFGAQKEPRYYPQGTKISDILRKEKPDFSFPCNGRGTCGKCRVLAEGAVTEPTERETAKLDPADLARGIRLACQTEIRGPLKITEIQTARDPKHILSLGRFELPEIHPLWSRRRIENPAHLTWEEIAKHLPSGLEPTIGALRQLGGLPSECGHLNVESVANRVIAIADEAHQPERYGVAIDIGTTTMAAYLVNLRDGQIFKTASAYNPQSSYGADVVSRIGYSSQTNGLETLQRVIVTAANRLIDDLTAAAGLNSRDIPLVHFVGNTCMTHLLCGVSPERLGKLPFEPVFQSRRMMTPRDIGLNVNPDGLVVVLPGIGGFVGSDISAGVLTCRLNAAQKELLIDIGTNGEIVLTGNGTILACSTAAGPAFEGAGISCGMLAGPGAIVDLSFTPDGIVLQTIDNQPARGICGTGLIRIITEFLRHGIITETGNFDPELDSPAYDPGLKRYYLAKDGTSPVYLSQADIRQFQLAKGAIRAGLDLMLQKLGISGNDLETFYIAGAFGNYMNPADALYIGLLPQVPLERIQGVGNTAGLGAVISLLSQTALQGLNELVAGIEHVELANDPKFMDAFTEAMLFPDSES